MPFRHGKNTVLKVGTAAAGQESTLVNLSAYLSEVSFPNEIETAETTTFGSSAKSYVVGLSDNTLSCSGMFDATFDAHIFAALGYETPLDFEYGPEGSATGRIRYTGKCYVTSYEKSGSVGDMVSGNVDFQCTGTITRSTYP